MNLVRTLTLLLILLTSGSVANEIHFPVNKTIEIIVIDAHDPIVMDFPSVKSMTAEIVTTKIQPKIINTINPGGPENDWQSTFDSMAAKLPGNYIIADKGSWGGTDLSSGNVYIAPRTPLKYLKSVMLHESIHVRQGNVYGDFNTARAALAGFGGLEPVADCGAIMIGATWTHYVSGCTSDMNHAAQAMLSGIAA